jgi:hypothetical protein
MSAPHAVALPAPRHSLGTLWLLAAVAAITVVLGWVTNEYVLTRDVYHQMLDARLDADRVDAHFDFVRQVQIWGYLATPVVVALRLLVVAMTVQLFLLLSADVPFRVVVRAACWAYVAVCAGVATRTVWLLLLPTADISAATMHVMPGSLASVVMFPQDYQNPLYSLLSLVNVFEVAWCGLMYLTLRADDRVPAGPAVVATAGTWTLLSTLQWAFTAYLAAAS